MLDTTYCSYIHCPFEDCERHASHLKKLEGTGVEIRVAWLCDTCRRYIGWLIDKATEQDWWDKGRKKLRGEDGVSDD